MIRKIAIAAAMMIIGLACFAESKVKYDGIGSDGYYDFYVEADTYEELQPYMDKFGVYLQDVIPYKARYRPLPSGVQGREYWSFEFAKKPEAKDYEAQAEVVHNTVNLIMKDWYREKYYMRCATGDALKTVTVGY